MDGWALLLKQAWGVLGGLVSGMGLFQARYPARFTSKNWGRVKKREERSGEGQDMRSWRKVGCYLEGAGGFLPTYLRASGPSTAQ